jgi:phosphoglycerate dehydrogenase-like enzyme
MRLVSHIWRRFRGWDSMSITVPSLLAAELPKAISGVSILVVRSKQVSAATIEAGSSLGLIVRAGAGVNTIDLDSASQPRGLRRQLSRSERRCRR